jgi:hypothetical protein
MLAPKKEMVLAKGDLGSASSELADGGGCVDCASNVACRDTCREAGLRRAPPDADDPVLR